MSLHRHYPIESYQKLKIRIEDIFRKYNLCFKEEVLDRLSFTGYDYILYADGEFFRRNTDVKSDVLSLEKDIDRFEVIVNWKLLKKENLEREKGSPIKFDLDEKLMRLSLENIKDI